MSVAIALSLRTYDQLGLGDIRPTNRGDVGGEAEIAYLFLPGWAAAVGGRLGAQHFEFAGPAIGGKLEEDSWIVRVGVDRVALWSARSGCYVGGHFAYGETHSTLRNLILEEAGPHNYFVGGLARAGAWRGLVPRLRIYGEARIALMDAYARDWPLGDNFSWWSTSFEGAVGIRYVVLAGR